MAAELQLPVLAVTRETAAVATITLGAAQDHCLPSFVPGSHVVLDCGGRRNAYSLIGDGHRPVSYAVSVLHRPDGAGGSAWAHQLRIGDLVRCSTPRNRFPPVLRARRHLYVAGGIGITALLSHVRAATFWGRDFRLLYGFRPGAGAHLPALRELAGPALAEYTDRRSLRAAICTALADQPLGTHLYVCGPQALMDDCFADAARLGWPASRLHREQFEPVALDPGRPLTVRLRSSGRLVAVPAGVSVLDALDEAGVPVARQCRQGVCGECRVGVRSGRPEHRDSVLSSAERAAGTALMACVSRGLDAELELDL